MALKLIRFVPYSDATELWHIFEGQRWQNSPPGSKYMQELFLDTKCSRATHPSDPKAKGKIAFDYYDKTKHLKKMCKDCIKALRANKPVPVAALRRGFHEG